MKKISNRQKINQILLFINLLSYFCSLCIFSPENGTIVTKF